MDRGKAAPLAVRREGLREGAAQFLRFCAVGGVGFCIDAAVLMLCIHAFRLNAITGRLMSFALAALATFALNRSWAFRRSHRQSTFASLATYFGVQGIGFLCNFGVYTLLYLTLPRPLNAPLFCLMMASGLALLVNYAGTRRIVFRAD